MTRSLGTDVMLTMAEDEMESSFARKLTGIFAAAVILLLSGCATKVQPLEYSAPVPEDQAAVLIIPGGYTVTNFNGMPVKWTYSLPGEWLTKEAAVIKIPAGNNRITYQYYRPPSTVRTQEQQGRYLVTKTTTYPAISFVGEIVVSMESGKKYIFEGSGFRGDKHEIILDTSDKYKMP